MPTGNGRPGRPRSTVKVQKSFPRPTIPRSQRYLDLLDGTLKVEDLDDDEIFRGQLRDRRGGFTGKPPELIPREMYLAMTRELRVRLNRKMEAAAEEAVETVLQIMREGEGAEETEFDEYSGKPIARTKAGVRRLDAAKEVLNRVLGQPGKELVGANNEEMTPWQRHQADGGLIVDIEPDEEDAHLITTAQERRKPIRRKVVSGEVVEP